MTPEEYLAGIPMWTRKKNSLSDIREFLSALGVSEENIIHVAGTNGKGSVCAFLTSVLLQSGYSTGTFVSPHLCDVKERFLLCGEPVGEDEFKEAFDRVMTVVKEKCAAGFAHPSYFEFCFLMAMVIFTEKKTDFRIIETGLGGRLDATNSLNSPLACVITSISLDHTRYLGDTVEEIAAEKAGIIKPQVPVIYDADDEKAADVIAGIAAQKGARAFPVSEENIILPQNISFAAPYQKINAALALKTFEVLNIADVTEQTIEKGLSSVQWQGRMEEVRPGIWMDGAHNPGGVSAFITAVKEQEILSGPFGVHLLFAVSDDKDYPSMIKLLCRELRLSSVTVTAFEDERSADPFILSELFLEEGCVNIKAFDNPYKALNHALGLPEKNDRLYITGSLYLIGALRPRLI